jgi:hypothetical protein
MSRSDGSRIALSAAMEGPSDIYAPLTEAVKLVAKHIGSTERAREIVRNSIGSPDVHVRVTPGLFNANDHVIRVGGVGSKKTIPWCGFV